MIKRLTLILLVALAFLPAPASAEGRWTSAQAENLLGWVERASGEGIVFPADTQSELRTAIDSGDPERLGAISDAVALTLTRAWSGKCCGPGRPAWWHIGRGRDEADLREGLSAALDDGTLDLYLRSVRPSHPHYAKLAAALGAETDPDRRRVIMENLARWRWLPAHLGDRYLLVNIAAQRLTLWDGGIVKGRWRVIVGKPSTRTPVFTTRVTGVVINPWWEIPPSIAAEGIARFVRTNPAAARARGYVYQNGRFRQMPGDNNALGRMKLVMPNPYSVFLHDTSNRELFGEDRRTFSHGCIRVDRALPFAAVLLARDGWDLAAIEQAVAAGKTRTIPLSEELPLYVTYFTAEPGLSGEIDFHEDIYRRDPVTAPRELQASLTGIYGSFDHASWDSFGAVAGAAPCPN